MRSFLIIALALATTPAAAEPCTAPANIETKRNDYAVEAHDDTLRVFHMAGDCGTVIGEVPVHGRLAFVWLDDQAPPSVDVETWLMHGDRLRRRYHWSGRAYIEVGSPDGELVLGPRKR